MSLELNDSFRTRLGRHAWRILPRVLVIAVAFVGLNWWVTSQKQAQTTEVAEKKTLTSAWDKDLPREPGFAIAIVLDEHQPSGVSDEAFENWREAIRQSITKYHSKVVKMAGDNDHLKIRVGLYHTAAHKPAITANHAMTPPSLADLQDALGEGRWTAQADDYDEVLWQAVHDLSQAGLATNTLLLVRHPERAKYLATSYGFNALRMSFEMGLPNESDGLMIILKSHDSFSNDLSILIDLTFPNVHYEGKFYPPPGY